MLFYDDSKKEEKIVNGFSRPYLKTIYVYIVDQYCEQCCRTHKYTKSFKQINKRVAMCIKHFPYNADLHQSTLKIFRLS